MVSCVRKHMFSFAYVYIQIVFTTKTEKMKFFFKTENDYNKFRFKRWNEAVERLTFYDMVVMLLLS